MPRVLRHVVPPVVPWPAGVVRIGSSNALLVDAALLPVGTFGPPAEHVARPMEVYRTPEGHALLMPALAGPVPPGPTSGVGGAVTLAVSMLRGIAECIPQTPTEGEWWLTPEGRPVFVPVAGGEPIRVAAATLLRHLDAGDPQPVFDALADELEGSDPPLLSAWEERLFALGRATAVTIRPKQVVASRRDQRRDHRRDSPGARRMSRSRSASARGIREVVSDAGVRAWRAVRGVRPGRRRLLLASAAAAAAIVLAVGLTWPEPGATEEAAGSAAATETDETDTDVTQPAESETEGASSSGGVTSADAVPGDAPAPQADASGARVEGDLAAVTVDLLSRLRDCADAACRAAVMEDPAKELPPGAATSASGAEATLVDDLGGIAVVRMDDGASPGQIVLIVSRDGKWLVRDVYDVADQP
jgi:hypothetical protein